MDISSLQSLINREILKLNFPDQPAELYDPARYFLSLGGKRLRPLLVLMGCELAGGKPEDAIQPALGMEVFHNFTLMHDDIMDNAPVRRNHPTVHARWNNNIAILCGDVMYTKACSLMAEVPDRILRKVLQIFNANALAVCEGQQFDMNFENQEDPGISAYLNMIRLKTAVLLGASLEIGAICGGADDNQSALLFEAGCRLGIAFQLQDDLLDVFGTSDSFGKRKGGDILSNKKTYLKLRALEKGNVEQVSELKKWYASTNHSDSEKIKAVTEIFVNLGVKEDTEKLLGSFFDEAISLIRSGHFHEQSKAGLINFFYRLARREF